MTYTTLGNVEEFFGTTFTASTSPSKAQVEKYISDVDTEIDNLTGTTFGTAVSNTEVIDIIGESSIFVTEKYPIVSVTSVKKNTSTDIYTSDTWEAIDYINDRFRIMTKYKYGPNKRRALQFIYTYGYETIPPEVEHLATLLTVNKILSGQAIGDSATQSISVGPISLTNSVGVSRLVNMKNEIAEYKRRVGRYKNYTR